jgi:hypothetical protein
MYHYPTCDWCGGEIRDQIATVTPGGDYSSGKAIDLPELTFHTSHKYAHCAHGISDNSCFGHVLKLLNLGGEFRTPDAGMEWRLVPASESHHYENPYTAPVLGTTPLAELGLGTAHYRKLTEYGIFTVEHAADLRARGKDCTMTAKGLGALDAALLERGLLPARAASDG